MYQKDGKLPGSEGFMETQKSLLSGFLKVGLSFLLLWVGWAPGSACAQSPDVCGPAPAVKAALDQLPEQTPALTDWQFHEQRAAALQALLRQYPDDVFVQRAYINSMYGRSDRDKVMAEYKARYERNSDNRSRHTFTARLWWDANRRRPSSFSMRRLRKTRNSPGRIWSW